MNRALIIAERIAEENGDYEWFCDVYTRRREFDSVYDSVVYTMHYLGLYKLWSYEMRFSE